MADFAYRPGTNPNPPPSSSAAAGGGPAPSAGSGGPVSPTGRAFAQRFPVYQIDFTSVASGKKLASTKRRIRWRFGFPNRDALDAGETGTACRGEEHDVTIVWSIASGKRLVLADGQEVHYSMTRGTKLEFSWTMRGNHVLKVVAHATSQVSSTPGWRQYDLFIDGQSFFGMPKVYELGIKGPVGSDAPAPGARSTNGYGGGSSRRALPAVIEGEPRSREEEEIELAKAISASLEESRQHLKRTVESHRAQDPNPPAIAAAPAGGGDLLDFGGPAPAAFVAPALPPSTNYAPAPPAQQPGYDASFAAAPPPAAMPPGAMVPVAPQPGAPYGGYGGAPPPQPAPHYGAAPVAQQQQPLAYAPAPAAPVPPAMDQFAAQPVAMDDPFAPKAPAPPTFNDVTSSIMGQYGGGAPPPAAPEAAPVAQQQYQQPPMEQAPVQQQPPVEHYNGTNGHSEPAPAVPEAQFSNLTVNTDPNDEDGISSAMKKLINIDDIGSPAEAPLTMNPFEDEKKNKTKAIPPVSQKFGNPSASLSEMQTIKSSASGEKKMVMNSMNQTYDASGGALVVSGTQSGGYSVPPPINRSTGFGVGVGMNGGGYGGGMGGPAPPMMQQQQQQPPMMQQQSQQMPMQQQPGYGAPPPMQQQQMPMQQPPMQQPMYGQQPPLPPQQGGYSNYTY